jgi:hypothetical protein
LLRSEGGAGGRRDGGGFGIGIEGAGAGAVAREDDDGWLDVDAKEGRSEELLEYLPSLIALLASENDCWWCKTGCVADRESPNEVRLEGLASTMLDAEDVILLKVGLPEREGVDEGGSESGKSATT